VANSSAGTTSLSEYDVSSGKLSSLGNINLGYIPVALAVAPSNSFLYVASVSGAATPGIYLYTIGSTGELTAANSGSALAVDQVAAMAISPDGKWLFTVNIDGLTMAEYSVNTTSGALSLAADLPLPGTTCTLTAATPASQSCSVTVGPSGNYVLASVGPSGDYVFPYSSSGGASLSGIQTISSGYSASNPVGNFSAVLDANNFAYIAQTNSVSVYGITSTAILSEGTFTFPSGTVPRSITLSNNDQFLYTANEGAGTISGFGISGSGTLTTLAGSSFVGPAHVAAIAVDNSGAYMVAVGYDGSAGVRLYSVSSAGVLTQVDAAGSGTNTLYPALVAVTH
jgi:6-phosphogluconolactonase (cycloisomerase 2 family)